MLRFNHMEITVPEGTIADHGDTLTNFMNDVFKFERDVFPADVGPSMVLKTDPAGSQFLFIAENPQPMSRASDDHLGFHVDSFADVDRMHAMCMEWQARDPRVEIRDFGIADFGHWDTRAFYVRFILPIWFDVHHIAARA